MRVTSACRLFCESGLRRFGDICHVTLKHFHGEEIADSTPFSVDTNAVVGMTCALLMFGSRGDRREFGVAVTGFCCCRVAEPTSRPPVNGTPASPISPPPNPPVVWYIPLNVCVGLSRKGTRAVPDTAVPAVAPRPPGDPPRSAGPKQAMVFHGLTSDNPEHAKSSPNDMSDLEKNTDTHPNTDPTTPPGAPH